MKKKTILLYGPDINAQKSSYGGGMGGYVRNVCQYLETFQTEMFEYKPCFHSVRKAGKYPILKFPVRFLHDIFIFLKLCPKVDAVHVLAQYRNAIYREFAIIFLGKIIGLTVIYDIKAGALLNWLQKTSPFSKALFGFIINKADFILCEGQSYVKYLAEKGIDSIYFPNFVGCNEIPENINEKLLDKRIKILFVGYCYEGKGVFELVEGCKKAAEKGVLIDLTLVGEEADEFKDWLNYFSNVPSLNLNRMGRLDHPSTLEQFKKNDIFLMPTRHSGEGHNNSINEAMMNGLVIVSTKHGFLEDVLSNECAYFLADCSSKEICRSLCLIDNERPNAKQKAKNAYMRLCLLFTAIQAKAEIENIVIKL